MTAWDYRKQNAVLVGILSTGWTPMAWSFGFRDLIIPGHAIPVEGMPYDHARNFVVHQLLSSDYEYVFMLDSDVVPPRDAIPRLIARKKPVIAGVYHRRSPPHGVPVMIRDGHWVTDYPTNAVIEVDLVGAGCLLIHRSVFEQLPPQEPNKPWFNWEVDKKGTGLKPDHECLSEDFSFNRYCKKKLGIPTLVDTSIQCRHIGLGEAVKGAMIPAESRVAA